MSDGELDAYCKDWAHWCFTRRYYLKPGAQNILARMQPSKTGREPNARNNSDMQYFNAAIHCLADMKEHEQGIACFVLYYVDQAPNVKREADRLGIARSTYYRRILSFARKAYLMSKSLKAAHVSMQEPELMVD